MSRLTAWTIALTLMRERYRRNFCLPNYTPAKWWECDVFELTEAGYFREYEIKLTLSDFKADAKKENVLRTGSWPNMVETRRRKHDCFGHECGPRQFWYVVPEGLLTVEQVPTWAGLIEVFDLRPGHISYWRYAERELKRAPILHRNGCDPKVKAHAESTCYWRLHTEWTGEPTAVDQTPVLEMADGI